MIYIGSVIWVKYPRWNPDRHRAWRHVLQNHRIRANLCPATNPNISTHYCTGANINIIFNHRHTFTFRISSDGNVLTNVNALTDYRRTVDNDTKARVADDRSVTNISRTWHHRREQYPIKERDYFPKPNEAPNVKSPTKSVQQHWSARKKTTHFLPRPSRASVNALYILSTIFAPVCRSVTATSALRESFSLNSGDLRIVAQA